MRGSQGGGYRDRGLGFKEVYSYEYEYFSGCYHHCFHLRPVYANFPL